MALENINFYSKMSHNGGVRKVPKKCQVLFERPQIQKLPTLELFDR